MRRVGTTLVTHDPATPHSTSSRLKRGEPAEAFGAVPGVDRSLDVGACGAEDTVVEVLGPDGVEDVVHRRRRGREGAGVAGEPVRGDLFGEEVDHVGEEAE